MLSVPVLTKKISALRGYTATIVDDKIDVCYRKKHYVTITKGEKTWWVARGADAAKPGDAARRSLYLLVRKSL